MSCPVTIYFIRDDVIVGGAPSDLGWDGASYWNAIADAVHQCMEYFDKDSTEFDEQWREIMLREFGQYLRSRKELLEYQHVVIPRTNKCFRRSDVHDLIKGNVDDFEFDARAMNLTTTAWTGIKELTRLRIVQRSNCMTDPNFAATQKKVLEKYVEWIAAYKFIENTEMQWMRTIMHFFGGRMNPQFIYEMLQEKEDQQLIKVIRRDKVVSVI